MASPPQSQVPHRDPPEGIGSLEASIAAEHNPIRRFMRVLGPGFIGGAADDDPSGIATYATAGAAFGFATLWTALLTLPLMATVQLVCAKIGMVTGKGLAGVLRQHYPRWLLYAVSEAFGWKYGLDQNPGRAKQFYAVIAIATLVGVVIDYLGINPIDALVYTVVINGFVAPPLLVMIMLVANNRQVMGKRRNGRLTNLIGWTAAAIMVLAAGVLVVTSI